MIFIALLFFGSLGFVFALIIIGYFCIKDNRKEFRDNVLRAKKEYSNSSGYSPFTPSKNHDFDIFDENINSVDYVRKNFLTDRERKFFERVILSVSIEYFVFPQVRLVDIITPSVSRSKNSSLYFKLFRSLSQYSVDFIIVRKSDYHVVCVIELDDSTHNRADRIKRDLKVNAALESADIFILRSRSPDYLIDVIKSNFS
ncbi:hypothetical protein DRX19_18670 [Salmonella enterica subsp. enterica]|nr:hypothetical protein [Salmonella enterica subsp. enterica serovar Pensacola]